MTMTCHSKALIEDVNNKLGLHETKNNYWREHGVVVVRNKLPYGDYMLAPPVVVDTKRDILELAANIKSDHRRFRDAAIKAKECGSHLIILVENEDGITCLDDLRAWVEPHDSYNLRRIHNKNAERWRGEHIKTAKDGHEYDAGIVHVCNEMSRKYGLEFQFCTPEDAGRAVLENLGVVMADE